MAKLNIAEYNDNVHATIHAYRIEGHYKNMGKTIEAIIMEWVKLKKEKEKE